MSKLPVLFCLAVFVVFRADAYGLEQQHLSVNGHTISLNVAAGGMVQHVATISEPAPRFLSVGPDQELIIGSRGGTIYRMKYPYTAVETLVTLTGFIHSAVVFNGRIYGAETKEVLSAPYGGASTTLQPGDFEQETVLPSETGGHSSRTIIAGPDNRLYVGLGISGNCSDEYLDNSYPFERRRGGVFSLVNGVLAPFSSGLRNPIGLAFRPGTSQLYATNAGPDNLGYDNPPEILARLSQGSFHGMPWFQYFNGAFRSGQCATSAAPRPVSQATMPSAFFAARSTPEGIVFLNNSWLGSDYDGSALAAVHGSWATRPGMGVESRRPPKLSLVRFNAETPTAVDDFVTGFQRADGSRFARPCGVAVGGDGNIYFTSDGGEVTGIYRIVPRGKSVSSATSILLLSN